MFRSGKKSNNANTLFKRYLKFDIFLLYNKALNLSYFKKYEINESKLLKGV